MFTLRLSLLTLALLYMLKYPYIWDYVEVGWGGGLNY